MGLNRVGTNVIHAAYVSDVVFSLVMAEQATKCAVAVRLFFSSTPLSPS
jgi:hypothetical protein